ncbi:DNA mismatch repair protein MutS, partial [Candidatus Gracilibacteria bacterium]|nr:DNA mismatch repair protein MutS [Candidatus Gracilibacteria bacterium]
GMFREGFSAELDQLRALTKDSSRWMEDFLMRQKRESGIQNLKIKYSNNFGFCLEVSKAQIEKAPSHWIRRQTLVNAERFTTEELAEQEQKILSSESKKNELEHALFLELREEILRYTPQIQESARVIARLDALLCFARTAEKHRWTRPVVVQDSVEFVVEQGRHPVVEKLSGEVFITNSLQMSDKSYFHLITGPNMAGKSTFLRQNAILVLLAQVGSFVPAKHMKTGIHDRIFTRVGASDNLAAGKSTFFVEMAETARILHLATARSFVILDEIGRGTSTFDGISLAWAISEFLHDRVRCKTLFATHFHELIELVESLKNAENFHVSALQKKDGIEFLRRVEKGGISDSFGIDVAVCAGIPKDVIENARSVLVRLESENLLSGKPNLFSLPRVHHKVIREEAPSELDLFLEAINPDELTPREALETIFRLKNQQKKSGFFWRKR